MTAPGLSEQELAEIDLAVAKVEGIVLEDGLMPPCIVALDFTGTPFPDQGTPYQPTRDPAEAMRLLEYHLLIVGHNIPAERAEHYICRSALGIIAPVYGPTPCIAIARAVISIGSIK